MLAIDDKQYPALKRLVDLQLGIWPDHDRFLANRFESANLAWANEMATLISRVAGDRIETFARDYEWLCEQMNEEELHFRRTGAYRLSTFEEAYREVYSNREFMGRYMNGVLFSHLFWDNHARVIEYYATSFLTNNAANFRHLEIGPGHGLLLYLAARNEKCATVTGWDVSETSLAATRGMLSSLGVTRPIELVCRNMMDAPGGERFDSIVISEVCEHLENPRGALEKLREHLAPGGRIFVNVPINSPAPDHIYLLKTPEEGVELVRSAGFRVTETKLFPMTGFTEQRARTLKATISCVVVGTPD